MASLQPHDDPQLNVRTQIAAFPIEDPFHEKAQLEKDSNRWVVALVEKVKKHHGIPAHSVSGCSPGSLRQRISDVYRLCSSGRWR